MNKGTSLYLDFIRAAAALVVFFFHAREPYFSQGQGWLPSCGHEMVLVFFVLSGLVIAHVVAKRRDSWRVFTADRLSRLFSVVIPALGLTVVLDVIVCAVAPASYYQPLIRLDHYSLRIALAGLFVNQSWGWASTPGSNGPFWSMAYEFWYYALFGGVIFARGWGWKAVAVAVFFLATGLKIALLLPAWLLGVAVYQVGRKQLVNQRVGAALALGSSVVIGLVLAKIIHLPGRPHEFVAAAPLYFSAQFGPDLLLGLLVAVQFTGMDAALRAWQPPGADCWWVRVIRFVAARSFSLYLFHMPVLVFLRAVVPFDGARTSHVVAVLGLALVIIWAVGEVTEQRRDGLRRWFRRGLGLPLEATAVASAN